MSSQMPDWWDWGELKKPVYEPLRLKENAPENVKRNLKNGKREKRRKEFSTYTVTKRSSPEKY